MREHSITIMSIAFFGSLGCLCRYFLSTFVYQITGRNFPAGTLAANGLGAFLIGLIMEFSLRSTLVPGTLRLGLTIGFLGGFTTFSTFSYETFRLLEEGQVAVAFINVTASVVLCLALTWLGIAAARQL
jgi:CrcB protein